MRSVLLDTRVAGVHVWLDAYPTLIVAGAVVGIALALVLARTRGLPMWRVLAVLAAAAVSVPIGARVLYVVTETPLFAERPADAVAARFTSFALYGGLVAASLTALVAARLARVDVWRLADACAPGILLGAAIAKMGCFCEGCCYGYVTQGPLGVTFPLGSQAHAAQLLSGMTGVLGPVRPVLPTQLFESAGALVLAVVAMALLLRGRLPDGSVFLLAGAGFSLVRLAVRQVRWIEPTFSAPVWTYPVLYVALVTSCLGLLAVRFRYGNRLHVGGPEVPAPEPERI